ncbi:MAG: hypothetical protein ACI8P3_000003 [Saprospiraceae bacterium]|jgi:hypothetical protein
MQFIPESIIDQKATEIGETEDFTDLIQNLKDKQPALLAFLFSENFDLLTQSEKDFTMFLTLVVWEAVLTIHPEQEFIAPEDVEAAEEANWEKLSENQSKGFRDKLDVFFENTSQEDLLAFVEDALVQDEEDDMISPEGREYVFITLKTIIDCLDQAA